MNQTIATLGMIAATAATQYFTVTAPAKQTQAANRDAAWSFADQLRACDMERKELIVRLLE